MNIYEKLLNIQSELKAPKNQRNSFGNYNYRSCEDILEAVKPLCQKYKALLTIYDEIIHEGDRYYIKATASIYDVENGKEIIEFIRNTAYARESEDKKGMDASQITGATSSYARKYALNGLFCIDDTKDADTNEFVNVNNVKEKSEILEEKKATEAQIKILANNYKDENLNKLLEANNIEKLEDMSITKASELIKKLTEMSKKGE